MSLSSMTLDFALPPAGPLIGVGIDMVDVARIKELRERHGDRFLRRVYTEPELEYCLKRGAPDQHLAARFAAKEAVSKAFTTGIGEHFAWKSISLALGARSQPEVELDDDGRDYLRQIGGDRISVSVSHTDNMAIAIAAIIGRI